MDTNEDVVKWVREKLKVLHDFCEEESEEGFQDDHWDRIRAIRDYVHKNLCIDTFGPIMTFSKNEIRDKDDNECLLDELLEESFDKNYGDDDANETNFDVLPRIFEGLCKSTSISMENREAAWDILLWFAVSSHDDILGGGELNILGDILEDIQELIESDSFEQEMKKEKSPLALKVVTYFRILFLITVAPEDQDDVSYILSSSCLEGFLDKIEENESMRKNLGFVQIFFMRYCIFDHDVEWDDETRAEKQEALEQNFPEAIQNWLMIFAKFKPSESLTCLEIDFMTKMLGSFSNLYECEKHGNIDEIINAKDTSFCTIAQTLLAETDLNDEILEVFFEFIYTIQIMPGFVEFLEKEESLKSKLQECYDENDVYIAKRFIFHSESKKDDEFDDIDDVMGALDSSIEVSSESGSEKGSEDKAKDKGAKDKDKPAKGKVMISYNWGTKPKARILKKILITAGFEVWIDEDGMEDDIVDSMAGAVVDSDIIVICASENYQKSKNCKSEAKFAYENDKPVVPVMMENFQREKWLRFIMGTKLYIPFYDDTLEQEQVKQFLRIVNKRFSSTKGVGEEKIVGALVENVTEVALVPVTSAGAVISETSTVEDLDKWFETHKISSLKELFGSDTEAVLFLQLKNMKKVSPSDYYKILREDFKLTGVHLLKFDRGIDRL